MVYNLTYFYFRGTSGIDIDLRRVDIDQCPTDSNTLNIFANSDKCKKATTKVCISFTSFYLFNTLTPKRFKQISDIYANI